MSWQQPTGNFNSNAPSYTPDGGAYMNSYNNQEAGGYYPPPQQYGGGGYYPPQAGLGINYQSGYANRSDYQGGMYNPQQHRQGVYQDPRNDQGGYYPRGGYGGPQQQQGGYSGNINYHQGGSYGGQQQQQQQQRYQQNEAYQQQMQQPPTPQPQKQQKQQKPAASMPAPKTSASDAAKLSLGGGSAKSVVVPKKKGGGTLSLGKKKQVAVEATAPEETASQASPSTTAEAKPEGDANPSTPPAAGPGAESPLQEKESAAVTQAESTSKPASAAPAKEAPGATAKDRAKATPEERREAVKKEIARQRQQSKKQYKRDPRPHFNIVFCGHVDAGKSTISGHLLMEKGLVDQREMEKLRREAEINHREGWEYAYVMDVSEEERSKGITRETGAAYFETEKRRVTVLDAPGHKAFVPSMIGGATQADICVLVISSRTGEFETGFEKGGQTREHAMLVRTCGVKQMICVINKMDEMKWSKERYNEIVDRLKPFLRQNGYDEERAKNLIFMPVAGLTGENLIKHVEPSHCDWYKGKTMMEVIDDLKLPESKTEDDVFCIPLVGAYKDDGKTHIYGKVESGSIAVGERIQVLPTKAEALVEGISIESTEFEKCYPGDNVHLHVRGIDENDIHGGYVATSIPTSLRAVEFFQARVVILEVKNIISAGSRVMLHIHSAQEEASFHKLLAKIDRKTNEVVEKNPACVKAGDVVIARIELDRPVVLEPHKDFDKLGRFMLRDDGRTIAIGVVMRLYESTHESLAKAGQ
ncbi:putative eukaryotic release factor 3 [Leishmania infantum JPCM5]|uniref:Eukaryotic_release_factor_3_-_putative n=2 Tax=Leishmania infantum TaxID=5671 RepID=A0A6L0WUP1_LEIIN|nr:putative eukaryotic release factor 3 [Leishmania infantum JPCM5]CAC9461549.1 eukaryotic_release_factor_3_-_putative [Leishmania infantum]CAM66288.1 putative eukaryotic release factor 3 [Leishmania infantum JPCM5]SUZ39899.1 eukaryotic_release_factor_3_-_putative [Leishmania infantum]|eukprot:XP_001463915.1 putative eukaryotic release factor 3 [Leishmania infantum JPCM5]